MRFTKFWVLHDKHGKVQITYTPLYDNIVLTRDKDGYFTSNRWRLLRQAIEVIVRGAERRRA